MDWKILKSRRTALAVAIWVGILALYVIVAGLVEQLPWVEKLLSSGIDAQSRKILMLVLGVAIFLSLSLPFSSATVVVLVGKTAVGAPATFFIGLFAGILAASTSYCIGRFLSSFVERVGAGEKVRRAQYALGGHAGSSWIAMLLLRAIPNPLYDVWGYAAGVVHMPFANYLSASAVGGAIPLAIICFLVR